MTCINSNFSVTQIDLAEQLLQITPKACYDISGNFYKIIYHEIC